VVSVTASECNKCQRHIRQNNNFSLVIRVYDAQRNMSEQRRGSAFFVCSLGHCGLSLGERKRQGKEFKT
jgi:hypothetical protein